MNYQKIYIDTSLLIDYFLATGREEPNPDPLNLISAEESQEKEYWESLLRTDKKLSFVTELRRIIGWDFPDKKLVISPFVLLELDAWCAEDSFKRLALDSTHIKAVQSLSRKEVGDYIQKVWEDAECDPNSLAAKIRGAICGIARGEYLMGIIVEPVQNLLFDEKVFNKAFPLACKQIGLADILHLLAAEAMGCTHFATNDSDYNRVSSEIKASFKLDVIYKDRILQFMKA